jgi:hypothetical protein
MPTYKNRPPMTEDAPVWRYLNLSGVIATIKTRQLRLTRIDTFRDCFEGSVPKKQIEDQGVIFRGGESQRHTSNIIATHNPGMATIPRPDEDRWALITRLRRALTRSAHASCWSYGDESEALWRLYCADDGCQGVGVALQTTLARLEQSVAVHDLYVSPIRYLRYHEAPAFTDRIDPLLHKRHGFSAERELRLLRLNEAHYNALVPKDASVSELPGHIHLDDWVLSEVIDEIIVSPYADVNYEDMVRHAIKAADPSLVDRVKLSELHERRYAPLF